MYVRTAAVAAVAVTAFAAVPLHPATADEDRNHGRLFLTVSGSQNTWIRGVRLSCPEPRGHHPHAAEACERLRLAQGRPDALPMERRLCTREYDPVTATAEGDWNGRPVTWRKTFPNACALEAATGAVFRF
ncbi:SSI family serine proteinase inhibitor [Streptomyces sp. NPDC049577]|uniref:SSI family serine proteinase inhibitor n=1 Tax=Streptomyces sp. NPDC049577 TaxID=3155153 RepID=UPI00343F5F33